MPDGRVVIQIEGDDSLLVADVKNLGRTVESQLGNMQGSLSRAGNALTLAVTAPVVAAGGAAFKMAASFETSMKMVEQATGASAEEMAGLSELAKKMGADTIYSANESADAMLELAKSGLTPAQIAAGALDAALQLAAAGDLALADAATVTANAINTFNLEADDAAAVANALAGGANASSASVQSLQQALAQVGPGAINAGLSLQETVGVLAAFADNGIQGSDAGTSLKTMLQRLVPQTDEAAAAMEALGLDFIDADGSFKSIDQIAQQLQDSLGGLTEAERAQALQTMFGSDATRAATVLMNEGTEGLAKYTQATNDQAAASGMAEARMSGAAGAMEQMAGSVETAALVVGEALAPVIIDLAGQVEELADWFGNLDEEQQQQIIQWIAIAAAAGPALKVLSGGVGVIKTLNAVAGSKAVGELAAGIKLVGANAGTNVGQLTSLGAGASAAAAGYVALSFAIGFAIGEMINGIPAVEQTTEVLAEAAVEADNLGEYLERAGERQATWVDYVIPLIPAVQTLSGAIANLTVEHTAQQIASDKTVAEWKRLGIELDENNNLTQRGSEQLDRLSVARQSERIATQLATGALIEYRDELNNVIGEQQSAESADLALERAKLRLEDAQARYADVMADYPADSREARDAALDLKEAELGVETSATRAREAHEKYNEALDAIPNPDGGTLAQWLSYYQQIGDKAAYAALQAKIASGALRDSAQYGSTARAATGGHQIPELGTGGHITSPMLAIVGDEEEWIINPKAPNAPSLFGELAEKMDFDLGGTQAPVTGGSGAAAAASFMHTSSSKSVTLAPVFYIDGASASPEQIADVVDARLIEFVRSAEMMGG